MVVKMIIMMIITTIIIILIAKKTILIIIILGLLGTARILRKVSELQDMKCPRSIVYTQIMKKQPV